MRLRDLNPRWMGPGAGGYKAAEYCRIGLWWGCRDYRRTHFIFFSDALWPQGNKYDIPGDTWAPSESSYDASGTSFDDLTIGQAIDATKQHRRLEDDCGCRFRLNNGEMAYVQAAR